MTRLDGADLAGYVQERHSRQARSFKSAPRLAIVRQGATPATDLYLQVKHRYGQDVGVPVDLYTEAPADIVDRIHALNADPAVAGIIVQLPFADLPDLEAEALAAVAAEKDIDGLAPDSPFEVATVKGIFWLLTAYNIDLKGCIVVVGQGRLVGLPLSAQLEASGADVIRADVNTPDLAAVTREADIIITATGQPGLITSDMVKPGAVVVDAGAPKSDLAPDLRQRTDLKITPNPGGVGPMTVAALFDNLFIAALQQRRR